MEFYEFHDFDFRDSAMEYLNLNDFNCSGVEFYEFHNFRNSGVE